MWSYWRSTVFVLSRFSLLNGRPRASTKQPSTNHTHRRHEARIIHCPPNPTLPCPASNHPPPTQPSTAIPNPQNTPTQIPNPPPHALHLVGAVPDHGGGSAAPQAQGPLLPDHRQRAVHRTLGLGWWLVGFVCFHNQLRFKSGSKGDDARVWSLPWGCTRVAPSLTAAGCAVPKPRKATQPTREARCIPSLSFHHHHHPPPHPPLLLLSFTITPHPTPSSPRTLYLSPDLAHPFCCCSRILTTSKGVTISSASVMPAMKPAAILRTSPSLPWGSRRRPCGWVDVC